MKLPVFLVVVVCALAASCSRLPLKRAGMLQKFAARLGFAHGSPLQRLAQSVPVGVFFKAPSSKEARSPQFSPIPGSPTLFAPVQGFAQQPFPAQGSTQHFRQGGRSPQELGPEVPAQGSAQFFDPAGAQSFGQEGTQAPVFVPVAGPDNGFGQAGFGPGAGSTQTFSPADVESEVVDAAEGGSATRYPETPIWGQRPVNRHFDSVKFCEYFMIPSETPINSYSTMRTRFYDNYDIMRCMVASEIIALPHNLVQDVRWAFNQIGRQSDPLRAAVQVSTLPFVMTRTVAALPVRTIAEFYKLSRKFVESQRQVTRLYVK